jgi:hypothetical protein
VDVNTRASRMRTEYVGQSGSSVPHIDQTLPFLTMFHYRSMRSLSWADRKIEVVFLGLV